MVEASVFAACCLNWFSFFRSSQHARYANGGAYPPDLSLITKARHDGQNYGMLLDCCVIVSCLVDSSMRNRV